MSAAAAPVATKASIMLAAAPLPALFDLHLAPIAEPTSIGPDKGMAAVTGLRQNQSRKPPRFVERQDLLTISLMGSKLRSLRIANAPQK
jgi:hypothetical protein